MRERIHAPDLAGATAWLNVDRPPSIRDLRGQLVILDFWTYCCINCMHVLPVLRDLEERHRDDPLVVIGVHSDDHQRIVAVPLLEVAEDRKSTRLNSSHVRIPYAVFCLK